MKKTNIRIFFLLFCQAIQIYTLSYLLIEQFNE